MFYPLSRRAYPHRSPREIGFPSVTYSCAARKPVEAVSSYRNCIAAPSLVGAAKESMPILNEGGLLHFSPTCTWPGPTTKKFPGGLAREADMYRKADKLTFCRVCPGRRHGCGEIWTRCSPTPSSHLHHRFQLLLRCLLPLLRTRKLHRLAARVNILWNQWIAAAFGPRSSARSLTISVS
jgi:hypothetical protein